MKAADRYLPWEAIYSTQERPQPVMQPKQTITPHVTSEPLKGGCTLFRINRTSIR